jgi:hypothetical protein
MKMFLLGIITMLFSGGFSEAGERYILKNATPWEESLASFSFDSANLRPLYLRAKERYPSMAESELAPRVEMNVKYIFHNRLNRERFLVAPSPQSIIARISAILELNEELQLLTTSGRQLLSVDTEPAQFGEVAQAMGEIAGELKDSFEDFFLEGGKPRYVFEYTKMEPASAQFGHFILQSEKINKDLTRRLDDFFFGASPGAVGLDDYESSSILVLSESLYKLSRLAAKDIARSVPVR